MKKHNCFIVLLVLSLLNINYANAQFGSLKKKMKKVSTSISKKNKEVTKTKNKLDKIITPSLSTFPVLIKSDPYKEQVKSSGAISKINKLDQLIVIYLRENDKWKNKGFLKYKGFLKSKIVRIETGITGVKNSAPIWFMLPFYYKTLNKLKTQLENGDQEHEKNKQIAYENELQTQSDKKAADSTAFVQSVYDDFDLLKQERPSQEEEEITSDLHRQNIGKIVFSKTHIPDNAPASFKTTTNFHTNDEIHVAAYLGKGIKNTYYKPTKAVKDNYKDLLLNADNYYLEYYIDGKRYEKKYFSMDMTSNNLDREVLSFKGGWHIKNNRGGYTDEAFIETMRTLPKGKHTIKIVGRVSPYIVFKDPEIRIQAYFEKDYHAREDLFKLLKLKTRVETKPEKPIFEGEFTIDIQGTMVSGYKMSDYKAGRLNSNTALIAGIKRANKANGTNLIKLKIVADDYGITRNKYSGAVVSRYVKVVTAFKSKRNGLNYIYSSYYTQIFDGQKFQSTWTDGGPLGNVVDLLDL